MTTAKTSEAFVHTKDGFSLVNVKFFVGDDRNTTQEQFSRAVKQAFREARLNDPVPASHIDGHLKKNKVSDIID